MLIILLVLLAAALLATVLLAWAWRGQRREHHYWRDHARDLRGELHRAGKVAASLAERVAGQAELLAKRAEKKEVPGE